MAEDGNNDEEGTSFSFNGVWLVCEGTTVATIGISLWFYPLQEGLFYTFCLLLDRSWGPLGLLCKKAGMQFENSPLGWLACGSVALLESSLLEIASQHLAGSTSPILTVLSTVTGIFGKGMLYAVLGSIPVFMMGTHVLENVANIINEQLAPAVYTVTSGDNLALTVRFNPFVIRMENRAVHGADDDKIEEMFPLQVADGTEVPENRVDCTICLDEIGQKELRRELPCSHWFHAGCCDPWLRTHNTCPTCKEIVIVDVDEDEESETATEESETADE